MRGRGITPGLFGTFLATDVAAGQTPTTTPPPPPATRQPAATSPSAPSGSTAGPFDRLSPGHQQIARALFQAQEIGAPSGTTTKQPGTTPQSTLLTLDQVAAIKLSGLSWGQVFTRMKTQGQIQASNLGQLASHFVRGQRARSGSPRTATAGETRRTQAGCGEAAGEETIPGGNPAQQTCTAAAATGEGDHGQVLGHGPPGPGGGSGVAHAGGRAR
jgi:hypothetical protein